MGSGSKRNVKSSLIGHDGNAERSGGELRERLVFWGRSRIRITPTGLFRTGPTWGDVPVGETFHSAAEPSTNAADGSINPAPICMVLNVPSKFLNPRW